MYRYQPKKPVKSFQDLEVYQKTLALSVAVAKRALADQAPNTAGNPEPVASPLAGRLADNIITKLFGCVLDIPAQIAAAHSLRFGSGTDSLRAIEKVMLQCNLAVVYLEQYRDLCNKGIEFEFFDEHIKGYLAVRYGEQAFEMVKQHGGEVGIGLAALAVVIGVAVVWLRHRKS